MDTGSTASGYRRRLPQRGGTWYLGDRGYAGETFADGRFSRIAEDWLDEWRDWYRSDAPAPESFLGLSTAELFGRAEERVFAHEKPDKKALREAIRGHQPRRRSVEPAQYVPFEAFLVKRFETLGQHAWREFDPEPWLYQTAGDAASAVFDVARKRLSMGGISLLPSSGEVRVGMLEPGLGNMFWRTGGPVDPMRWLTDDKPKSVERFRRCMADLDVVYLVLPNNPDGKMVDRATLKSLLVAAEQPRWNGTIPLAKTLVAIDMAFFDHLSEDLRYDVFAVAAETNADVIIIPDTGKGLALRSGKVAELCASKGVRAQAEWRASWSQEWFTPMAALEAMAYEMDQAGLQPPESLFGTPVRIGPPKVMLADKTQRSHSALEAACRWATTQGLPMRDVSKTKIGLGLVELIGSDLRQTEAFLNCLESYGILTSPGDEFMSKPHFQKMPNYFRLGMNEEPEVVEAMLRGPFQRAVGEFVVRNRLEPASLAGPVLV